MAALTANSRHINIVPVSNGALYYSYSTVVAVSFGGVLYITPEKYSVTTSRHCRKFAFESRLPVEYPDAATFAEVSRWAQR